MQSGLLALLGLGIRARTVVVGAEGARATVKRGRAALIVVAEDRSRRTEQKVVRLAEGAGVSVVIGPPSVELGRLSKRGPVQALAVTDANLARGISGLGAKKER